MSEILKADFSNARVGDRVKCLVYGEGRIIDIVCASGLTNIIVGFTDGYVYPRMNYIDGNFTNDGNDTLFYHFKGQFPTIEACTRPFPKIDVDERIWVWGEYSKTWLKGYFKYFDTDGYLCVFECGATSWSTDSQDSKHYKYWKLASDEIINSGNLNEIEGENE